MTKHIRIPGILLLVIFCHTQLNATHIRAGEITATLISCQNYTYRFAITGYTDTGSDVQFGGGEINYGDGSPVETFPTGDPDVFQDLGEERALNIFYKEHTFPGPGTYKISFREFNRNEGIANMDNSVNTPFYIETVIIIDPFLGCNNTPLLLNPPIDEGCIGVSFFHNAGAIDRDGDSISYEFTIPKQDQNIPVVNYSFPNDHDILMYNAQNEEKTGPATFTIDPLTGDIIWDAPGGEGEYNLAFKVIEWRKIQGEWFQLGYVTRDMQVIVTDCENEPPEITVPPDTCIVAGSLLEQEIFAEDPDFNPIILSSFGSVYELFSSPATYTPYPPSAQPSPAVLNFSWQTNCSHVRERPYQVRFKAVDQPNISLGQGPKLADYATWFIRVVGPPPEGLMAEQGLGNFVNLTWDPYECNNATLMQIWRRVDSYDFEPDHCELGMPDNIGYELIQTVDIDQTGFQDTGLEWGVNYCYRLVALFQDPAGGESIVSEEACILIEEIDGKFGSLVTNVSIEQTHEEDGQVLIRWTSPFDIDETEYPPPYTYELYRGTGFVSANSELVTTLTDTVFTDSGLDTYNNIYNYHIVVYDDTNTAIDTTATASSLRLELTPVTGAMELGWTAHVPWSNLSQKYPTHYIYRDNVDPNNPEQLVLFDSVDVTEDGLYYFDDGSAVGDDGLNDTQEYCYYVIAKGVYGNGKIPEPFLNNSQIICGQPHDTIPPCPPIEFSLNMDTPCEEFVQGQPCNYNDYYNELSWDSNSDPDCDLNISGYNIYFSESGDEGTFNIIDFVSGTNTYRHEGLNSFRGCYMISAVDRSGNESELSEVVCNDNCPYFELPNIFTPNADGSNDVFMTYLNDVEKCPRFIRSVHFQVYNRYGRLVFDSGKEDESSINIMWNGKTNDGQRLPSAMYYYTAKVKFDTNDPLLKEVIYKGWVRIMY